MKVTYETKFQLNKDYEMHSISIEVTDEDFPECKGMNGVDKGRYLQAKAMTQGLLFQATKGYLPVNSPDFKAAFAAIQNLEPKGNVK